MIDIKIIYLITSYLIFIFPLGILWYYKTGLTKNLLWAIIRMTMQLSAVGFYLVFLFENNWNWLNIFWVIIMTMIAAQAAISRSNISIKKFFVPVAISMLTSLALIGLFFLLYILQLKNPFEAKYLITICGMILGNCLGGTVIALRSFFRHLEHNNYSYKMSLMQGANASEALRPIFTATIKDAISPTLANMMTIGLISIPGMMTGQILGGSTPWVAAKYQMAILLAIFSMLTISVFLTLLLISRKVFNEFRVVAT